MGGRGRGTGTQNETMPGTQTANDAIAAIDAQQGNDGGVGTAYGGGNGAALGNGSAARDNGDAAHGSGGSTDDDGDAAHGNDDAGHGCDYDDGNYGANGGVDGAIGARVVRGNPGPEGPHKLLMARANSKRTYTSNLRKVRRAITDRVSAEELDLLEDELTETFQQTLALHQRYCSAAGRDGKQWEDDLYASLCEVSKLKVFYAPKATGAIQYGAHVDDGLRRTTRLQTAAQEAALTEGLSTHPRAATKVDRKAPRTTAGVRSADRHEPGFVQTTSSGEPSRRATNEPATATSRLAAQPGTDGGAVARRPRDETAVVTGRRVPTDGTILGRKGPLGRAQRDEELRLAGVEPVGDAAQHFLKWLADQGAASEADLAESIRSMSSRTSGHSTRPSHASAHSNALALARRRAKIELELEQLKVEEEEEAQLAELERSFAEAKRELKERRHQREVRDAMNRLRVSDVARRAASARPMSLHDYDSDPEAGENEDPSIFPVPPVSPQAPGGAWSVPEARHDDWIDGLKLQVRRRNPATPMPTSWSVYGAGQTCSKPFDGDPREWPLFISRFRALVHDMLPDDAQRVAILADWLGPSVKRRVETLLTAPQGYGAVLDYLRKQYGSPDKVSRCRIADLLALPSCRAGDFTGLQAFSDLLHGTVIVLQQAGNVYDLCSAANLEQVVQKLPVAIKGRWARLVMRLRRTPDLSDLDQLLQTITEEERLMRPSEESSGRAISSAPRTTDKTVKKLPVLRGRGHRDRKSHRQCLRRKCKVPRCPVRPRLTV